MSKARLTVRALLLGTLVVFSTGQAPHAEHRAASLIDGHQQAEYAAASVNDGIQEAEHASASLSNGQQETVTVYPGATALDPATIRPHEATWRLIRASSGDEIGRFTRVVEFVNHTANEPTLLTRWHFATPERSALDIYYVDRRTLMPIARYVTAPNGMWVQYQSEDRLVVSLTRRTGGEPLYVDTGNPKASFNNAMLDFVLASLPLADGYVAHWTSLGTSAQSMNDALVTVRARVQGRESKMLPDGSPLDTWRVAINLSNGNRQQVWIANQPPYLVQRDALDRNGNVTVRWELVAR